MARVSCALLKLAPPPNFLHVAIQQSGSSYPLSRLKHVSSGAVRMLRDSFRTSSMVLLARCKTFVLAQFIGWSFVHECSPIADLSVRHFTHASLWSLILSLIGAISDGRLIIGITKFDGIYEDESSITEKVIKQKVIQSIRDAAGVSLPEDVVIPFSGRWALKDCKLIYQLKNSDDHQIPIQVLRRVIEALERDHVSLPVGQGQSQEDAITRLRPKELVKMLETASGISNMKTRYAV